MLFDESASEVWSRDLARAVQAIGEEVREARRHFHRHPECSGREYETSMHIYERLGDAGLSVQLGREGRGVIADLGPPAGSSTSEPAIFALRADLDALQISDAKNVPYRSCVPGVMHACGHDAHAAILLGAMRVLKRLADEDSVGVPLRVRGIFQPAEETVRGAREMVELGVMEGVAAIAALHVDPSRPVGTIGVRKGPLTSNCDEVEITITGRGGHAARPHEARDPVAAAAQLIQTLYSYVPRSTDSQDAVVLTICQVIAGDHANVIPERVVLRGTLRTLERTIRDNTIRHIDQIVRGLGEATRTRITVSYGRATPSVVNDAVLVDLLGELAERHWRGRLRLDWVPRPSMGSEDFALYLDHAPGLLMRLGCRGDRIGGRPLHSEDFDIDEGCLVVGVECLATLAIGYARAAAAGRLSGPAPRAS